MLLTVLVLGQVGIAKTVAPISQQQYGEGWDVRADEKMPLLTAGELFTIRVLPEIGCFDGPAQNCIQIEWITIAEVLNGATADSICLAEADAGGLEDLVYDFSESSMSSSFLVEMYRLGIGCFEMLLPQGATKVGLLPVLGDR